MPLLTPLFTLLGAIVAAVLTVLGVNDPALTSQVQASIVAAGALVVSVLAYCHHASKQNADAVSVAAAQAANQATALAQATQAGRHSASPVAALTGASLAEAVSQVIDARAGTVATAPALPPAPAGPTLPGPATFPAITASTPGAADDYPTQEIAAVASVPAGAR